MHIPLAKIREAGGGHREASLAPFAPNNTGPGILGLGCRASFSTPGTLPKDRMRRRPGALRVMGRQTESCSSRMVPRAVRQARHPARSNVKARDTGFLDCPAGRYAGEIHGEFREDTGAGSQRAFDLSKDRLRELAGYG